ncbi:hypothetical protein JKP88DRAFT_153545, partial [Tribonema minus]
RAKLRYVRAELGPELGGGAWREAEFWLGGAAAVAALWTRMYLHYLGQWAYLKAVGAPVYLLAPRTHYVTLKFASSTLPTPAMVGFVAVGAVFVTACFVALVALAAAARRAAGTLPEWASRFVAAFGVGALLDPLLIFLVDACVGNHGCAARCADYTAAACACQEGEAWALYARLEAREGAGVTGVFITALVYAQVMLASALVLYAYLLRAHMNGRMLDAWRRLNGADGDVFVPHDFEVSAAELEAACAAARRWRGPVGARREVTVTDYEQPGSDHADSGGSSAAAVAAAAAAVTHVGIHEIGADGTRTLHRQFMRTADGAILELFGRAGA